MVETKFWSELHIMYGIRYDTFASKWQILTVKMMKWLPTQNVSKINLLRQKNQKLVTFM